MCDEPYTVAVPTVLQLLIGDLEAADYVVSVEYHGALWFITVSHRVCLSYSHGSLRHNNLLFNASDPNFSKKIIEVLPTLLPTLPTSDLCPGMHPTFDVSYVRRPVRGCGV